MRLSDLRDAKVKTLDGETLGRVHEVHSDEGRITALTCGPGSFIEALTAKKKGRRIPWEFVLRIDRNEIIVTPDPPRRTAASRSRQGTRRASGPRSVR
jgi:sporulation protein YlmC with PRC-barrel domain